MQQYKNITLALVDGVDPESSLKTLHHCASLMGFGKVKLFSFREPSVRSDKVNFIKIKKLDYEGYNEFVIKNLNDFINTDFCLLVQTDGFILNPQKWQDSFFEYDYIGAPWEQLLQFQHPLGTRVGNGGFSLRSKKFLEVSSKKTPDYNSAKYHSLNKNEDFFLCKTNYQTMIQNGIKIADLETAANFSLESPIPEHPRNYSEVFGFHSRNDKTNLFIEEVNKLEI